MQSRVILASQSLQRKAILETAGIPFEVIPADLDEKQIQDSNHKSRVATLARAKAMAIHQQYPDGAIIAADTYPELDGVALEKPENLEEAVEMLKQLSGKTFYSHTGFCYIDELHDISYMTTATTETVFRKLSMSEIERYVQRNPVTTWSAAFCPAYPEGAALVATIRGSLTGFTHGLPMEEVIPLLKRSGLL